jgi:uncharacterized OsmC-like protein
MAIANTDRIAESVSRFTGNPAAGRATPEVTAELSNGHGRLSSGSFNWEADLGPALGGQNVAPSPTQFLLGALAGCAVVFLANTLAPQFGVVLDNVRATARCAADAGGLLGIAGASPALEGIALEVEVESAAPRERLDALFDAWLERCPIYLALLRPNDVSVKFAAAGDQVSRA